jgi:hypothetical protein
MYCGRTSRASLLCAEANTESFCKFSSQKNYVLKNRLKSLRKGEKMLSESQNLALVFQKHSLRAAKTLFLHPENTVYAIP